MREQIAALLKDRRRRLGRSVREVVEALEDSGVHVSEKTVYSWESGHRQPDADTFLILCQLYGVQSLGEVQPSLVRQAAPALPEDALGVARDYAALDRHGKNMVKIVLTEERKRLDEARRRQSGGEEPRHTRIIPLYYTPAAAGMVSPAAGQDFDYIEVSDDAPRSADLAVKIDGDSMEPYIMDGSIVYVNRETLENGDVGIFCIDGNMICKQYYRDGEGNVHLLSLNRSRSEADRYIHCRDNDTVMSYYGRVILPRRPPISLA